MKTEDIILLQFYKKGFHDELNKKSSFNKAHPDINLLNNRAYILGCDHAILGDENRSFDYLSEEEILKQIKNDKNGSL